MTKKNQSAKVNSRREGVRHVDQAAQEITRFFAKPLVERLRTDFPSQAGSRLRQFFQRRRWIQYPSED